MSHETQSEETYYSPEKVAKLSFTVVQTIYRHIQNGKFPGARKIGIRKWLIPEEDVIAYLGYDPNTVKVNLVK